MKCKCLSRMAGNMSSTVNVFNTLKELGALVVGFASIKVTHSEYMYILVWLEPPKS
jgi:hypothetical protein